MEELAQDFSTRNLTTRKDGSSEQVRDRLGRIVYEKFQEGEKMDGTFSLLPRSSRQEESFRPGFEVAFVGRTI